MLYASRHPDLFIAAGSFSGFVDQLTPAGIGVVQEFSALDNQLCGANDNPMGIWGDPVIHPMGWESHDPTFLATNLRGLSLYIASGNGVPCPDDVAPDPNTTFAEATVGILVTTPEPAALESVYLFAESYLRWCLVRGQSPGRCGRETARPAS